MRRARTRRERREKEKRSVRNRRLIAVSAIVGVIVALTAIPTVLIVRELTKERIELDEFGCSETFRPAHIVILIDQTDDLPPQWASYVQRLVPALARSGDLPDYGRLSVYSLTDDRAEPLERWLSECKPPNNAGGSFLFDTQADRSESQERLQAFYEEKIAEISARFEGNSVRDASPILEGLVALSQDIDDAELEIQAERTHVIVVSDMLQFTREAPRITHYGESDPDFTEFFAGRQGRDLTPLLDVERMTVHYVRREDESESRHQTEGHVAFWRAYFEQAGVEQLNWNDDPRAAVEALPQG